MALADDASVSFLKLGPDGLVRRNVVLILMIYLSVPHFLLIVNSDDLVVEVESKIIKSAIQVPSHYIILHN